MKDYEVILLILKQYNNTDRTVILANLNMAIAIQKENGLPVDRYVTIPIVTNRSKYTVMQWFQRDWIKIPVVDLGILSEYLGYNIHAFFVAHDDGLTKTEFIQSSADCDRLYGSDCTHLFNSIVKLHLETDKMVVISNIEDYFGTAGEIVGRKSSERREAIMAATGCNVHTCYAWFNKARTDIRIPLESVCRIAKMVRKDVRYMLTPHEYSV